MLLISKKNNRILFSFSEDLELMAALKELDLLSNSVGDSMHVCVQNKTSCGQGEQSYHRLGSRCHHYH